MIVLRIFILIFSYQEFSGCSASVNLPNQLCNEAIDGWWDENVGGWSSGISPTWAIFELER